MGPISNERLKFASLAISLLEFIPLLFALTAHDCGVTASEDRLRCLSGNTCEHPEWKTLKFFLIGDIGGLPVYPYTTYAQGIVAKSMAKMGAELKSEFQICLGDNIYYTGVENVFDERFKKTFEEVYEGDATYKPWYFIAGNHDHFGNITAQIEYTKNSTRWTFPSLYYKISYKFGPKNTTVDFIMIDTMVLCGNTRDIEDAGFFEMLFADVEANPNNPKDPEAANAQWNWIERELNESSAEFLFVAGHYPVYSVSGHGSTTCLVEKLNPLLIRYRVSAYFAGHDHNLQHLRIRSSIEPPQNLSQQGYVHYIVSGAASRSDRSFKHENDVPVGSLLFRYPRGFNPLSQLGFSTGGFVFTEINDKLAKFKFFDGDGEQKYVYSIPSRTVKQPIVNDDIILS